MPSDSFSTALVTSWFLDIEDCRYPNRRSFGVRISVRLVFVSSTSTDSMLAFISEPWPPAFILTAPPIVPGTPTAHSNPESPFEEVDLATTGSFAAPPTYAYPSMILTCSNSVPSLIINP